ncbi:hypothetical protein [Variovorax boronicumulans]|uniref:hypothetical protein n=1 Tax=Variovorax boronicumulans TaxID=436515 RepID=UPI00339AD7AB
MLKEHFLEWDYSDPASAEAISDAEIELGIRFPIVGTNIVDVYRTDFRQFKDKFASL